MPLPSTAPDPLGPPKIPMGVCYVLLPSPTFSPSPPRAAPHDSHYMEMLGKMGKGPFKPQERSKAPFLSAFCSLCSSTELPWHTVGTLAVLPVLRSPLSPLPQTLRSVLSASPFLPAFPFLNRKLLPNVGTELWSCGKALSASVRL